MTTLIPTTGAPASAFAGTSNPYGPTEFVPQKDNTSVAASSTSASSSSGWQYTPYVSKNGNAIFTKTVMVTKGRGAGGKGRVVYAEYIGGKYKKISFYEITTGKKPPKGCKKKKPACKKEQAAPKRRICKKPKTELQKARAKFNNAETAEGRKRDKKMKAPIVKKAKDYVPSGTDFKGVDTPK